MPLIENEEAAARLARAIAADIRLYGAAEVRWVTADQLDHYAFPAANRKLINLLKETFREEFQ